MPCMVEYENVTSTRNEKHLLCKACRLLTKKQMLEVLGRDGMYPSGLFEWYLQHLLQDYRYNKYIEKDNDAEFAKKELQRIGYEVIKVDNRYEVTQIGSNHDN